MLGDGYTPVKAAADRVMRFALDGCARPNCPACREKRALVDALIAAVREEERLDAKLRGAGVPPEHL